MSLHVYCSVWFGVLHTDQFRCGLTWQQRPVLFDCSFTPETIYWSKRKSAWKGAWFFLTGRSLGREDWVEDRVWTTSRETSTLCLWYSAINNEKEYPTKVWPVQKKPCARLKAVLIAAWSEHTEPVSPIRPFPLLCSIFALIVFSSHAHGGPTPFNGRWWPKALKKQTSIHMKNCKLLGMGHR